MPRKLTLEQINQQIARLHRQAAEIRDAEKAEVVGKIKVAIDHYGMTAADLGLSGAGRKKASKANGKASPKAKASSGRIKFKDDAGRTWSGHGRRPQWFIDALAAGKTEADLRA